jgi:hypothetical protein
MTSGTGQSYQWQVSTDSINWASLPGATASQISLVPAQSAWYRLQITCGATAYSLPLYIAVQIGPLAGGSYTINPNLPSGGNNFQSPATFAKTLHCAGISGGIEGVIASGSGPYEEEVIFRNIPGANDTTRVVLNGNGEKMMKNFPGTTRGVILFHASAYIKLKHIEIENIQPQQAYGIEFRGDARFIEIDSFKIFMNTQSTANSTGGIVMAFNPHSPTFSGLAGRDVTIENGEVYGGYYGIVLNGPTSPPWANNNILRNVKIADMHHTGVYVRGQFQTLIQGNDISKPTRTSAGSFTGIQVLSGASSLQIIGNRIHNNAGGNLSSSSACHGIHLNHAIGQAGDPLILSNNKLYNFNSNGTIYGIYVLGGNHIRLYHNTISIHNNHNNFRMIKALNMLSNSGTYEVLNNIFDIQHQGSGIKYLVYSDDTLSNSVLNHNQYFISGNGPDNYVIYHAMNYGTLAAFQTSNGFGHESHGVYGDPQFSNALSGNLLPANPIGHQAGFDLRNFVPLDFYGLPRKSAPDLGAREIGILACNQADSFRVRSHACNAIEVEWYSAPQTIASSLEIGPVGFSPGAGFTIHNAMSPQYISGLAPETSYDIYLTDSCLGVSATPLLLAINTDSLPTARAVCTPDTGSGAFYLFDGAASSAYDVLFWDFGDGLTDTGIVVTHQYLQNGTYQASLMATNSCGTDTVFIPLTVNGISQSEIEFSTEISIFPNPTKGVVLFALPIEETRNWQIEIRNASGQIVLVSPLCQLEKSRQFFRLNLSSFPAGTYFLQLVGSDGIYSSRLILTP